jgi:hypothetical protein
VKSFVVIPITLALAEVLMNEQKFRSGTLIPSWQRCTRRTILEVDMAHALARARVTAWRTDGALLRTLEKADNGPRSTIKIFDSETMACLNALHRRTIMNDPDFLALVFGNRDLTPEEREREEVILAELYHTRLAAFTRTHGAVVPREPQDGFWHRMWRNCKEVGLWLWDLVTSLLGMTYDFILTTVKSMTEEQRSRLVQLIVHCCKADDHRA